MVLGAQIASRQPSCSHVKQIGPEHLHLALQLLGLGSAAPGLFELLLPVAAHPGGGSGRQPNRTTTTAVPQCSRR